MSAFPEFMLAFSVMFLIALISLIRWHHWKQFAIREGNRADRSEAWLDEVFTEKTDLSDYESYPQGAMPAPTNSGHKSHGDNFCSIFDQPGKGK